MYSGVEIGGSVGSMNRVPELLGEGSKRCSKSIRTLGCWGFFPDPTRELTALPRPPS